MSTERFNSYVPSKDLVTEYGEVILSCTHEIRVTDLVVERLECIRRELEDRGVHAFSSKLSEYDEAIKELKALLEASATTPREERLTREELAKELIADVSKEELSTVVSIVIRIRTRAIKFVVANFPKATAVEYIRESEHSDGIGYWCQYFFTPPAELDGKALWMDVEAYADVAEEIRLSDNAS